jgi:hypothetical protein
MSNWLPSFYFPCSAVRSENHSCDKSQHSKVLECGDLSPLWISPELKASSAAGYQVQLEPKSSEAAHDDWSAAFAQFDVDLVGFVLLPLLSCPF